MPSSSVPFLIKVALFICKGLHAHEESLSIMHSSRIFYTLFHFLGNNINLTRFPFPCLDRFIFRLENGDSAWEVLKKWEDGDAVGYLKLS